MAVPSLALLLSSALAEVMPGDAAAVHRSDHADFQANGALALARTLGQPPRPLALAAAAAVPTDLAAATVAGPGFVNLTVTDATLHRQVARRLADERLGVPSPEHGVTTVVDYSQPNVAKEMHVGHLRSTVIGDALVRVLEHLGGTVVRRNHIGDWGTQFGMLVEHVLADGAETTDAASMTRLSRLYRAARATFDRDPSFVERSRRRVVALQQGDPATVAVWRDIVAESTAYFSGVYARLGVRLTPEDVVGESAYNDELPGLAAELADNGVAVVSQGALCVFFDDLRGPDGVPVPLIVRKGDGGFGYAATDLAALRHRVGVMRADRVLYVVDARQALHFRMVFETAARAGWLPSAAVAAHVGFGLVLGADGRPFKTRSGDTVRLVELLDEAVERARSVVVAKSPDLDPAALDERAAQVGLGAVKYADLANNRARDYVYDPDRMLALTGNTSVYLQFAHARLCSILARAGVDNAAPNAATLTAPERSLVIELDGFAEALTDVARTYEPHRLCGYLYGLAQAVTAFVERCPVLKAEPEVRAHRLALCRLAARTLRQGLDLLGIAAPARL